MFQKIAKHRANDASNDVHRPPLSPSAAKSVTFITHIASCIQYVVHYQGTGLSADAKA